MEGARRGAGSISGALTGPDVPPPRPAKSDPVRTVVRTIGEVLITLGVVVLLFVFYEVYVTDLISAGKQRDATTALDNRWKTPESKDDPQRVDHFDGLSEGDGFAKMYIPAFGPDYHFTIVEGTTEKSLEVGPGHYTDTAYPGEPGNFAVAGHRVGKGAPFNDIDLVSPCDAIIVETQHSWFVYRMLPEKAQKADWAAEKSKNPKCANVNVLGDPYADVVGQEIVAPNQGSVIATVPHKPNGTVSAGGQAALMTLTTCHPKFSDRQRLIVHAVLDHQIPKDQLQPGQLPEEMKEG
jgi:LPXTG-site transpeptidase (sortase) family protein